MSTTDGRWEQNTSFPDLQYAVDPYLIVDTAGHATYGSAGSGLFSANLGASVASTMLVNLMPLIRTGVYATPAYDQEQFGTAAHQPGPSTVAGTGSPLGLLPGFPPLTQSQMATLGNIQTGPIPKGTQIDSIDLIYTVTGAALTLAQVGLTKTAFVNNTAPAVTNLIALGANGLATAVQAQPYVINVPVPSPAMITTSDAFLYLAINFTTQAGGSLNLYGAVVRAHYNFN